jgi:hypothetical protein
MTRSRSPWRRAFSITPSSAASRARPVQLRAARLPPLQDRELVAQDQDLGGLPRLLTPGQWTRTVNGKTVTRQLTPAQYQAYAPWFASARRLRRQALAAELEAISLQEMARAEGWPKITPGSAAPARTRLIRAPKPSKPPETPGDQPA